MLYVTFIGDLEKVLVCGLILKLLFVSQIREIACHQTHAQVVSKINVIPNIQSVRQLPVSQQASSYHYHHFCSTQATVAIQLGHIS